MSGNFGLQGGIFDRLEEKLKSIILETLSDIEDISIADIIEEKYAEYMNDEEKITPGKKLSDSPLVQVLDVTEDDVFLLFRGRIDGVLKRLEGDVFWRIEMRLDKNRLFVGEYLTVMVDTQLTFKKMFEAKFGAGYDKGGWFVGRGGFLWIPTGLGIEVFLGGLSSDGFMLGAVLDLPTAIPLGNSGVGLKGFSGDFAWNFVPRLETEDQSALDYARWARNDDIARWMAGPANITSIGIGSGVDIVDVFANGNVIAIAPAWLAALVPGPIFIMGGNMKLLNTNGFKLNAYMVIAYSSGRWSIATSGTMKLKLPFSGTPLVEANGTLEAFFDFANTSAWFLHLGTKKKPIKATILKDALLSYFAGGGIRGDIHLEIDSKGVLLGATALLEAEKDWSAIGFKVVSGFGFYAELGWDPWGIGCEFKLIGEIGFWVINKERFKFQLSMSVSAVGHIPDPKHLKFLAEFKLDLPWPMDDVKEDAEIIIGGETEAGPALSSPIGNEGSALHAISGHRWTLDEAIGVWPDVNLIVPFTSRVSDETGKVLGERVGSTTSGAFEIIHSITKLEVINTVTDQPVDGLIAAWAESPGGSTADLHLLAPDPFSQLSPHYEDWESIPHVHPPKVFQGFRIGMDAEFQNEQRFGEILVDPIDSTAYLSNIFSPMYPTRTLITDKLRICFRDMFENTLPSTEIKLHVIEDTAKPFSFSVNIKDPSNPENDISVPLHIDDTWDLGNSLRLVSYGLDLGHPIIDLEVSANNEEFCLATISYNASRPPLDAYLKRWQNYQRIVLVPSTYRIIIEGNSVGLSQIEDVEDKSQITWSFSSDFKVIRPDTLRPYIKYTTSGDSRIFGHIENDWNPTVFGTGFPLYRQYFPVIRFHASYISQIYDPIKFKIVFENATEDNSTIEADLNPLPNQLGEYSLSGRSIEFINQNGGNPRPDQELVYDNLIEHWGPAEIQLMADISGETTNLDKWNCIISRYSCFTEHLTPSSSAVSTAYAPGNTLSVSLPTEIDLSELGNQIEEPPSELASPPVDWRLPASLTSNLRAFDKETGIRFVKFLDKCEVNINQFQPPMVTCPAATTLQAIVDGDSRIIALWIRTPEPLDWRRVSMNLTIHQITPETGNPEGLEQRIPLEVDVTVLPSPDATSALLIGSYNGIYSKLPRGYYILRAEFQQSVQGLIPLLTPESISSPEVMEIQFVQLLGKAWPRPRDRFVIPYFIFEKLMEMYEIPPHLIDVLQDILDLDPVNPFDPRDIGIHRTNIPDLETQHLTNQLSFTSKRAEVDTSRRIPKTRSQPDALKQQAIRRRHIGIRQRSTDQYRKGLYHTDKKGGQANSSLKRIKQNKHDELVDTQSNEQADINIRNQNKHKGE